MGESKIKNCYNTGNVVSQYNVTWACVGGISCSTTYYDTTYGQKKSNEIINCYNLGKIQVKGQTPFVYMGGVLGLIQLGHTNINNCYSSGGMSTQYTDNIKYGGILGRIVNNEQTTITNCSTTSAMAIGQNEGTSTSQTITNVNGGQTNLPSVLSVINTDNNGVFVEDSKNINNGYPILKWQLEN